MEAILQKKGNKLIRADYKPYCLICGSKGEMLYQGLQDRLFDAPGKWDFRKCPKRECGLIWLDPMPIEEDIGRAYIKYYTHQGTAPSEKGFLTRVFRLIREGYLSNEYRYSNPESRYWKEFLGQMIWLFPMRRSESDIAVMYLPALLNGRLLDIGCGSGEFLRQMQDLGWRAEGIDLDEWVANNAKNRGLLVHHGSLGDQNYPDEYFDAITMRHAIEHIHTVSQTLRECQRILKHGGKLMVETPNSDSFGHRVFKKNWIGLDPPRHLHLINSTILKKLVNDAGFELLSTKTAITQRYVIHQSHALHRNSKFFNAEMQFMPNGSLFARIITIMELISLSLQYDVGESIVLTAQKG